MSGVGFWEVMLVFLIGLIVLGPERLPRVAQQLGTWLGQARRMTRVMKRQLEEELNLEKDLSIRRPAPLPRASQAPDRAEKDDRYSPAHDADAPGTGVGSDSRSAEEAAETPQAASAEEAPATPQAASAEEAPETPPAAAPEGDTPAKSAGPPAQEKIS